jgi:hypothetical protein
LPDFLTVEPASFRDPDSRVFLLGDEIVRALSQRGLEDWEALSSTRFFERFVAEGRVVATRREEPPAAATEAAAAFDGGFLRHERLEFVSYPYEWPFGMLRDAGLLQLDLLEAALGEGMILKDASPYNVQWRGAQPVFVDVGSFERLKEGEPWVGYRQFCMQFLYPLLLQAYRDLPFQPWLRGSLAGITPTQCRSILRGRDLLRRGSFSHVFLHAKLERRYRQRDADVRSDLKSAGFRSELIVANVRKLSKLLRRLKWDPPAGVWTRYEHENTYTDADTDAKERFVAEAAGARPRGLVWDLGCNTGRYSRIAARHARAVVAIDSDHAAVELLYRSLRDEGSETITPLVVDLVDPSPGLGWRGVERGPLAARGRPELALCLALLHHLVITGGVPLVDVVDWLADLGASVIIEFVRPEDQMVERLMAAKGAGTRPPYDEELFAGALDARFDVERREELPSGTRVLYLAHPRT